MHLAVRETGSWLRRHLARAFAWLFPKFDAQDLHLWFGLALLALGLSQVYAPMLLIAPGAAFTYLAWPKRPIIAVRKVEERD